MTKFGILLVSLLLLAFVGGFAGCGDGGETTIAPQPTPTPKVPAQFSTYTSEGLFRISYPPDWVPATATMGELWEQTREAMESETGDTSLEDASMIFLAGMPTNGGYAPSVSVIVIPRSQGYWTLEEVAEAEDEFQRMYPTPGYQLLSRTQTRIGGQEALIDDSVDDEPGYGKWRYIQMMLVNGRFVWLVTCSVQFDDFPYHEDDFYAIVRSFRVLQ